MSNRLYPTWDELNASHNPLTPGERALIQFLDANLPSDPNWNNQLPLSRYNGWLIFAQPYFNGSRPDVVILNPSVGMMIYEVKDWDLSLYSWQGGRFCVQTKNNLTQVVKSPVQQVKHYRDKLISQLVPEIGEQMDREQNQDRKPSLTLIKTALYFHRSTTRRAQQLFEPRFKKKPDSHAEKVAAIARHFQYEPVIGYDSLTPATLSDVVPEWQRNSSYHWKAHWNKEILFWMMPPFHSIEQGTPLTLKGLQFKVAEPQPGHHRIRGVAGSGKTQALAYRAAKLASQGLDVLIITYNITLWHYIHDMIKRAPFAFSMARFTLGHFHGFCKDRLNDLGRSWPSEEDAKDKEDLFRRVVPEAVAAAIKEAPADLVREIPSYDAILIDEGQDYYYEWYDLLSSHFLRSRDELLVVCDKKQNIYERELLWLDKRNKKNDLGKFLSDYIDLKTSYRLPDAVTEITNEFSETFALNQDLRAVKNSARPTLIDEHHIVWVNIERGRWLEYLYLAFQRLKRAQYHASDMVFLLPSHEKGFEAVEYFTNLRIQVNHVFETDEQRRYHPNKKAFWVGDGRLKMATIHSFKGWEAKNIVLLIDYTKESEAQLNSLIYTALTRTRQNLIVLNAHHRFREFGEKLPKHWNEQITIE
jgi:Nuclease-related domain/AAA domain/UvrD-like helicase C-terminal domain